MYFTAICHEPSRYHGVRLVKAMSCFTLSFTEMYCKLITARKQSLRRLYFYRCLSVHRGGVPGQVTPQAGTPPPPPPPPGRYNPRAGTPPAGTPPGHGACWDTVNKWTVRIPLECILVCYTVSNTSLYQSCFLNFTWDICVTIIGTFT